jgi:hypothetical protein
VVLLGMLALRSRNREVAAAAAVMPEHGIGAPGR